MVNVSSAMAGQFVAYAQEMTETIETLGVNPLRIPQGSAGQDCQTAGEPDSIRPPVHSESEVSP